MKKGDDYRTAIRIRSFIPCQISLEYQQVCSAEFQALLQNEGVS